MTNPSSTFPTSRSTSSSSDHAVSGPSDPALDFARTLLSRLGTATCSTPPEEDGLKRIPTPDAEDRRFAGLPPEDPAFIGAVVLLGRVLGLQPQLVERLMSDAAVVILEVAHAEWISPVEEAVLAAFGTAGSPKRVRRGRAEQKRPDDDVRSGLVVIAARGTDSAKEGYRDREAAYAFLQHRSLIGITTPLGQGLPKDLVAACEARLVLGRFDAASLALVVEHVVGKACGCSIAREVAVAVEPGDLRIALHPSRGAEGSTDRLATVVGKRLRKISTSVDTKLEDLAGYGAALEWGLGTASDLSAYARGELDWEACERGVLLVGLPGTGKTLFAGSMARQAGIPIVAGSLAQWQSVGEAHLGTTLKAMRGFFEAAATAAPCVALIDELDSFGSRQNFQDRNRQYASQVVNGLLECLDGQSGRAGVFLVGTTNIPERIDPAILRAGRFDRCVRLELPSIGDLAAILRHHLGHDLAGTDLEHAARSAAGSTGADCAALVRRARGRARRAGRPIRLSDLMAEIGVNESEMHSNFERRAAIHESGHAIIASGLGISIENISLRSAEDDASASIRFRPSGVSTAAAVRDMLTMALAGRAAEVLVFGTPTASAAADLEMATSICRNMHCRWGLGARLSVCETDHPPHGIETAVERELQSAMRRAVRHLSEHLRDLHRLADALLERRSLEAAEVALLVPIGRQRNGGMATTGSKGRSRDRSKVSQARVVEPVQDEKGDGS